MNVLMVGVGPKRVGGMWTVADYYINNKKYNKYVNLTYVATSTNGSLLTRVICMIIGYLKIKWILLVKPIELVHIHMAEKGSTFRKGRVAKWAKKKNKRVIIHLHAGPFMAWYKTVSEKDKKRIKGIFGLADCVLVLGDYWKQELTEIIPFKKMRVLYNGVECPKRNPYSVESKNIVYFGVMRKEKGIYDLIEAIKKINNRLPKDVKVILCGNDLEGDISDKIIHNGLKDRVELMGWVKGYQKEMVYKSAMLDVLPSYYEGFSMTVLEAMAQGIPVVTTNISTMPEMLGDSGVMINPGDVGRLSDEILSLVYASKKRMDYSEKEWNRANELFSVERCIEKTLRIYKDICCYKKGKKIKSFQM